MHACMTTAKQSRTYQQKARHLQKAVILDLNGKLCETDSHEKKHVQWQKTVFRLEILK